MNTLTQQAMTYRIAEPRDRQTVLSLLAQSFVHEPSTAGCTLERPSYDQWRQFTDFFLDECVNNGLSVVAIDEQNKTRPVIGAFIVRDFLAPLSPEFEAFVPDSPFAPAAMALQELDEAWLARHPEIPANATGRVADLWMLGVKAGYTRQGVATTLTRHALDLVTQAGFDYAVVECTGAYSQRIMTSLEFEPVHELPYSGFLWQGEPVFQNVSPPHTKWVIYEKQVQT
jgi:ribosomal protein S18 acetylase RimI-like enzyme